MAVASRHLNPDVNAQNVEQHHKFRKDSTKKSHAKGRSNIVIDKAKSFFCVELRVVSFYQQIQITLSGLLNEHQKDIALI